MADDDVIVLLTRLQYVWKREGFHLNLRQTREAKEGQEFLTSLKLLLTVDLKRYAQGAYELEASLPESIYRFKRGAVITRHFSREASDVELADQLLQALIDEEQAQAPAEFSTGIPQEFQSPCWLDLYRSWCQFGNDEQDQRRHKATRASAMKEIPFREMCIFLQKHEKTSAIHEKRLLGLLTFIGNRFRCEVAVPMFLALSDMSAVDSKLFQLLLNGRLLRCMWQRYGTGGVAEFLECVTLISQRCEQPLFGEALELLCEELDPPNEFAATLMRLKQLAEHEGVALETLQLLTQSKRPDRFLRLLEMACAGQDALLSIDAQRLLIAIMCKYKLKRPEQFQQICQRFAKIGLDRALCQRLIREIVDQPQFAKDFIRQQLDHDALLGRYEQSTKGEQRFYYLTLIACQHYRGYLLGSITRGLSVLLQVNRKSMMDDSHFRMLVKDLTDDLPRSLTRLHEQPDDLDIKLRQLYVPLMVAGDLLHSRDAMPYLSDFYFDLRRRDREAQYEL